MFRIILCDDSEADLTVISGYLKPLKEIYPLEVICYQNGLDLIHDYTKKEFCDILVLDMRMDSINGIEVAKRIRQVDRQVSILIVTATVDYAVEGYLINAFRYIVKPVLQKDFTDAVTSLIEKMLKNQTAFFTFPSSAGVTKLKIYHIYYLESDLRTIRLVAKEGAFTFTGKISLLEEQLRQHGFIRIHKSFLVNVSHIHNIFKDSVTMDNQDIIPMSKHKRKDVSQEFLSYMEASL